MGDVHSGIVNNDTEVVSRPTVGSHYYQVIELGIFKDDPPLNMVIYNCLALKRHLESDYRLFSGNRVFKFPASAVVFRDTLFRKRLFPPLFKLFRSAIAVVSLVFLKEFFNMLFVNVHSLSLAVWSLIPVKTEPLHTFNDCLD